MTTNTLTAMWHDDVFTSVALIGALESAWAAIRTQHPELPAAVIVVASGSSSAKSADLKYGHFASLRRQHGDTRLPEVFVSGEGLRRTPAEVFTTLLHEAAHAIADVRNIQDTSRQGRWHNKHFATLAGELGLTATKDPKLGWSPCTLQPTTANQYASVLAELGDAMRAYRHPEEVSEKTRSNSNNGLVLECDCPRKIRVSVKVADEGPIVCGVCDTPFRTDQRDDETPSVKGEAVGRAFDPTGEYHGGTPTYPYRTAPTGLATRRQLRTLGLRPGGQPIAAQILWRKGKRVAHLYRVDLARPKRTATPAQLAAIAKALTARRTCPTCGQVQPYYIPRRYGECLICAGLFEDVAA
jgi:hypothetical protein